MSLNPYQSPTAVESMPPRRVDPRIVARRVAMGCICLLGLVLVAALMIIALPLLWLWSGASWLG